MTPLDFVMDSWSIQYDDLKTRLGDIGHKADSLEYNLYATQALQLHECIADLQRVQINELTEQLENT